MKISPLSAVLDYLLTHSWPRSVSAACLLQPQDGMTRRLVATGDKNVGKATRKVFANHTATLQQFQIFFRRYLQVR